MNIYHPLISRWSRWTCRRINLVVVLSTICCKCLFLPRAADWKTESLVHRFGWKCWLWWLQPKVRQSRKVHYWWWSLFRLLSAGKLHWSLRIFCRFAQKLDRSGCNLAVEYAIRRSVKTMATLTETASSTKNPTTTACMASVLTNKCRLSGNKTLPQLSISN